jgi:hypothetical protein
MMLLLIFINCNSSKYYNVRECIVLTAPANSKRAGAQWQICVDAFGFAGGYATQLPISDDQQPARSLAF